MFKIGLIIVALALIGLAGTTTTLVYANNMGPAMGPADSGGSVGSSGTTTSPYNPGEEGGNNQWGMGGHNWGQPTGTGGYDAAHGWWHQHHFWHNFFPWKTHFWRHHFWQSETQP